MKRSTFLKLAMVCLAVFVYVGANAQTYVQGNNIRHNEDAVDYEYVAEDIYQTTGLRLFLYAAPDPVYSPNYDGTGARGTNLNAASQWRWVYGASYAAGTQVLDWTTQQNWVEITPAILTAAGSPATFYVKERTTSCEAADATAQAKIVYVLPVPTATLVGTNNDFAGTEVSAGREYYRCGEGYTDELTLTFTETGVPNTLDYYAYTVTVVAEGFDINGNSVAGPTTVATLSVAATDATFVNGPTATIDGTTTPACPTMNYLSYDPGTGSVDVRTSYTFTLTEVASRVSTVSHTRAGVANTFYAEAGADDIVTYWLNLPPVTGPIYHVPNNFAL